VPSIEEMKNLRKRLRLTQSELAELAGVSQSLVSQIESGEVDPRISTLRRIIEALNREETDREVNAEDICIQDVIHASPDDPITDAAQVMWSNKISQLPVLDEGRNIGSVSEKTINAEIARGSSRELEEGTIREIMQDPFPMVGGKTRIEVVVCLLQENLAVLVMDEGAVSGIITKADVLRRLGPTGNESGYSRPASSRSSR
jgi:predicted transcriptional regulator